MHKLNLEQFRGGLFSAMDERGVEVEDENLFDSVV